MATYLKKKSEASPRQACTGSVKLDGNIPHLLERLEPRDNFVCHIPEYNLTTSHSNLPIFRLTFLSFDLGELHQIINLPLKRSLSPGGLLQTLQKNPLVGFQLFICSLRPQVFTD